MHDIPVFSVVGRTIPEAWERSLERLWGEGVEVATQYDAPDDPPSKDCTMMMVVQDPLSEPMIHRDFPGGLEDLQEYVMEVCDGIKDHWVRDPKNPQDLRWEYTYHNRLFAYGYTAEYSQYEHGNYVENQIENICQQLSKCLYTRRAQAITWKVGEDNSCYDPPCLQSIWCRILPADELYLNMDVRFRSRDAYKAAFMNMFALVQLQKNIADRVGELINRPVKLGRYCDISDSYHVYGKNLREFQSRFLKATRERSFEQRTFRYEDVKDVMQESIPGILKKVQTYDEREKP